MSVRMRRRCFHGLLAGMMVVVFGSVGMAQPNDPAYGVWKLNVAKSKFSPGPAPKEMTLTIKAAGPGRDVTVSGVAGDGTPVKWGYSGNFDGKVVRVTGDNPDADIVILKRISANTTRTTYQKSFKRTLVNGISVSSDGKTLTVAQQGVNAKKETVKNTLVFDKQ
jgi:hypothetical protein